MEFPHNTGFDPRADENGYAPRPGVTVGVPIAPPPPVAPRRMGSIHDADNARTREQARQDVLAIAAQLTGDQAMVGAPILPMPMAPPKPAGRKDDSGKLDMTLLDDMPRAIAAVVQVMQWAIVDKKPTPYGRGSWLGVHADRYRAAIGRHTIDQARQVGTSDGRAARFQTDPETRLLHQAHIACSALMALENTIREMEEDHAD